MSTPSSSSLPATDNREKSSSPEELYSLGQQTFVDDLFDLEFLKKAAAHDEEERLHPSPAFQPPEDLCKKVVETQAKSKFVLFSGPSLKVPRYPLQPFSYELHIGEGVWHYSGRKWRLCGVTKENEQSKRSKKPRTWMGRELIVPPPSPPSTTESRRIIRITRSNLALRAAANAGTSSAASGLTPDPSAPNAALDILLDPLQGTAKPDCEYVRALLSHPEAEPHGREGVELHQRIWPTPEGKKWWEQDGACINPKLLGQWVESAYGSEADQAYWASL